MLATVKHRSLLRSLGVPDVMTDDRRELDVAVSKLPKDGSKTLLLDATLRSPLAGEGVARPNASNEASATFHGARKHKARVYLEFHVPGSGFVFLVASELGGHSFVECHALVAQLAKAHAS